MLPRVSLGLTALVFAGFGLLFLIRPEALSLMEVTVDTPTSRIEVRGFYGGMEIGLAVFFALAAARPAWFRPGLVVQIVTLGGMAAGRLVGVLVDGAPAPAIWLLTGVEILGALIGAAALASLRRAG